MNVPLFTEIEATIARLNILPGEGAENARDMAASILEDPDMDGDYVDDSVHRKALLECMSFCVAGIRDIDRGTT